MATSGTGNVPHMEAWSSSIKSCLAAWTRKFHTSGEDRRASQAVHCVGGSERGRGREKRSEQQVSQLEEEEESAGCCYTPTDPPTRGTVQPGCGAAQLATRPWLNMKWGVVMQMTLMCAHICQ